MHIFWWYMWAGHTHVGRFGQHTSSKRVKQSSPSYNRYGRSITTAKKKQNPKISQRFMERARTTNHLSLGFAFFIVKRAKLHWSPQLSHSVYSKEQAIHCVYEPCNHVQCSTHACAIDVRTCTLHEDTTAGTDRQNDKQPDRMTTVAILRRRRGLITEHNLQFK